MEKGCGEVIELSVAEEAEPFPEISKSSLQNMLHWRPSTPKHFD